MASLSTSIAENFSNVIMDFFEIFATYDWGTLSTGVTLTHTVSNAVLKITPDSSAPRFDLGSATISEFSAMLTAYTLYMNTLLPATTNNIP